MALIKEPRYFSVFCALKMLNIYHGTLGPFSTASIEMLGVISVIEAIIRAVHIAYHKLLL